MSTSVEVVPLKVVASAKYSTATGAARAAVPIQQRSGENGTEPESGHA